MYLEKKDFDSFSNFFYSYNIKVYHLSANDDYIGDLKKNITGNCFFFTLNFDYFVDFVRFYKEFISFFYKKFFSNTKVSFIGILHSDKIFISSTRLEYLINYYNLRCTFYDQSIYDVYTIQNNFLFQVLNVFSLKRQCLYYLFNFVCERIYYNYISYLF